MSLTVKQSATVLGLPANRPQSGNWQCVMELRIVRCIIGSVVVAGG